MIHLNKAPIFLEFLQKVFDSTEEKYYHKSIADEFYIVGKCNCNQSDCASVILKKRTPWKKEIEVCGASLRKGYVNIFILEDNYLEIECIYHKFPHKYEINRLLNKNGKTSESLQVKRCKKKKIDNKNKMKLRRYFNNKMSLYESLIYERLDYRSCSGQRLFQHLK